MDRWKSRGGKSQRKRQSQKKEDAGARKGGKAAKHCVFPMICGSGGSKSRLAKAAGVEPCGEMRDEKLHAVVARSTFPSKNALNTMFGPLLEVEMSKKCTSLWREAHFEVKSVKADGFGALLDVQMSFCVAGARDYAPCQKWSKREGFVALPKNDGRHGTYAEDLARCLSRGRRSTRDMFIRAVRRSGRWFPERGCILEHQIVKFAKIILRDRCSTSYDLASLFPGRRSTLDRWSGKIAERIGTRPWALHSTFHFWRKSRRLLSFLMLSTSKVEESRRIVSFLMLSSLKIEEVSQNCLTLSSSKNWGSLAE